MITALLIGVALGYLGPKLRRKPVQAVPAVEARRQLGAACVVLRQNGFRVQEKDIGSRTFVIVDKKAKE